MTAVRTARPLASVLLKEAGDIGAVARAWSAFTVPSYWKYVLRRAVGGRGGRDSTDSMARQGRPKSPEVSRRSKYPMPYLCWTDYGKMY